MYALAAARCAQGDHLQIAIADVSMSLDNVLAVAGAAMKHVWVLVVGLMLSIALMGFAPRRWSRDSCNVIPGSAMRA